MLFTQYIVSAVVINIPSVLEKYVHRILKEWSEKKDLIVVTERGEPASPQEQEASLISSAAGATKLVIGSIGKKIQSSPAFKHSSIIVYLCLYFLVIANIVFTILFFFLYFGVTKACIYASNYLFTVQKIENTPQVPCLSRTHYYL
jgi:hypothetical protein